MNRLILMSAIIALASGSLPSFAQNNSNCRVINQSANGLAYPSSSYITPGTLSKTAQEGAGYTPQANPGLPKVNHGAYLGTPGDNLYSGNPDLSQHPQPIYSQRPSRIIYKQLVQPIPKVYIPDANIPMSYADYKDDSSTQKENTVNDTVTTDRNNLLPIKN